MPFSALPQSQTSDCAGTPKKARGQNTQAKSPGFGNAQLQTSQESEDIRASQTRFWLLVVLRRRAALPFHRVPSSPCINMQVPSSEQFQRGRRRQSYSRLSRGCLRSMRCLFDFLVRLERNKSKLCFCYGQSAPHLRRFSKSCSYIKSCQRGGKQSYALS